MLIVTNGQLYAIDSIQQLEKEVSFRNHPKIKEEKNMYCSKCGKELPDQTQFCTHCGARQNVSQPLQARQPRQSQQAASSGSKTGMGKTILLIVAIAVVIMVVRGLFFSKGSSDTASNNTSTNTIGQSSNSPGLSSGTNAGTAVDLTSSCAYGALYENDYLIYGAARLYLPSYETLIAGEGNEVDNLMYWDETRLFNVNMQSEIGGVSYANTTEEGMLASVRSVFADASVVKFEKTRVNGYQVIRYIIECTTVNGVEQYLGEMILFPEDPAYETLRFGMVVAKDEGYSCINQTFDTLEISSDFILTYEDTGTMGAGRIPVK